MAGRNLPNRSIVKGIFFTFVMLNCLIVLCVCVWNLSEPKSKLVFYAFIMNNKILLYLYCIILVNQQSSQEQNP